MESVYCGCFIKFFEFCLNFLNFVFEFLRKQSSKIQILYKEVVCLHKFFEFLRENFFKNILYIKGVGWWVFIKYLSFLGKR